MDDMLTMCFFGLFVLFGFLFLMRLMSSFMNNSNPYGRPGNVAPTYDDPDIGSSGAFGGRGNTPSNDDPDISSRGAFGGRTGGGLFSKSRRSGGGLGRLGGGSGRRSGGDNPNIGSRGGFGRDKK